MTLSRRDFFKSSLLGTSAAVFVASNPTASVIKAAQRRSAHRGLEIAKIKRTTVKVPFREVPARNMDREIPHWRYSEIFEVTLKSGHTGFGETLLFYTWGATTDADVKRAEGKNAAEIMWDDSLGAGLQMALFDAVARANDVPVHALLGNKVNDRTPLSWWNIDTSAKDMALECQEAKRQGYKAYKTKGRPWFDVWKQVDEACKVVPDDFMIDMDFNDTLLDAKRGIPILKDLEKYPQICIYETPIPQGDIKGNQAIKAATHVEIAHHYGHPKPLLAIREDICDGFIVGRGARTALKQSAVCEMAEKPFWLQLVGTSITAAWSLHFGGVCANATWPAVNCHQLFTHAMLTEPIVVKEGFAAVPDSPGLGYELDHDAIQKFKIAKPPTRPEPKRMIETTWPDGRRMYIANDGTVNFMLRLGQQGKIPYVERGVDSRLYPNDGSQKWADLYERARKGPVMVKS